MQEPASELNETESYHERSRDRHPEPARWILWSRLRLLGSVARSRNPDRVKSMV